MADNLPRPSTPGPWRVGLPNFRCRVDHGKGSGGHGTPACVYEFSGWLDWSVYVYQDRQYPNQGAGDDDDGMVVGTWDYEEGGVRHEQDANAIAALPERIRRMDAVRALCEQQVERGYVHEGDGRALDLACQIRALLDGEGVS